MRNDRRRRHTGPYAVPDFADMAARFVYGVILIGAVVGLVVLGSALVSCIRGA